MPLFAWPWPLFVRYFSKKGSSQAQVNLGASPLGQKASPGSQFGKAQKRRWLLIYLFLSSKMLRLVVTSSKPNFAGGY
jgi:hypothetical protein